MKKIFLLIFLFAFLFSKAQYPNTITSGNTSTLQKSWGSYGGNIGYVFIGTYGDTTAANLSFIKNVPGQVIRIGDDLWIRNNAANQWLKFLTGSAASISDTASMLANYRHWGAGYEKLTNKATDFSTLNNTLYPTTQAVANYISSQGFLTSTPGIDNVLAVGQSLSTSRNFPTGGNNLTFTGAGAINTENSFRTKPSYTSNWVASLGYSGNGTSANGSLTFRDFSTGGGNTVSIQPVNSIPSSFTLRLPEGNDGDTLATKAYARSLTGGFVSENLAHNSMTANNDYVQSWNGYQLRFDSIGTFKLQSRASSFTQRYSYIGGKALGLGLDIYSQYDNNHGVGIYTNNANNNGSQIYLEAFNLPAGKYNAFEMLPNKTTFYPPPDGMYIDSLQTETSNAQKVLTRDTTTGKVTQSDIVTIDFTGASAGDKVVVDDPSLGTLTTAPNTEGTHGLTQFVVGGTGAPVNGATSYTNTEYIGRRVKVYVDGFLLDSSSSNGYTFNSSTGQITFAHAITTGQPVWIEDFATNQIIYRTVSGGGGGGGGLADLDFPTNVGLSNSSGVWTGTTGTGGDYANKGLSDKKLLGTSDGYIQFQYAASDGQNAILGMNTTNSNVAYGSMQYGAYVFSGTIYAVDNGSPTSTSTSISVGDYIKIEVVGTTVKLYKSPDGSTWGSSIYTFSRSRGEDLYINTNVDLSYKLYYPKGYNLN